MKVLALREQYVGRMEVLLGLEWDRYSDMDRSGFDYWIGSVHYQRAPDGAYYTTDWDDEKFLVCLNEGCGGNVMEVVARYYAEAARVAAKKPTILGHFDGITKLNKGNQYFDEESPTIGSWPWRHCMRQTRKPACWRSIPAACSRDIVKHHIPLNFSWRNGGPWAVGSS